MGEKVRSLDDVERVVQERGDEREVRIYIYKKISSLSQGKGMLLLLEEKIKDYGWKVKGIKAIKMVATMDEALVKADSLLGDLIALTDPEAIQPPGSSRFDKLDGDKKLGPNPAIGDKKLTLNYAPGSSRNANFGHASSRSRDEGVPASAESFFSNDNFSVKGDITNVAPPTDLSVKGDITNLAPPADLSVKGDITNLAPPADLSVKGDINVTSTSPVRPSRTKCTGGHHNTGPIVPVELAKNLRDVGNVLECFRLASVSSIGEMIGDLGAALMSGKKDRAAAHLDLNRARDELERVWNAEFNLKDLNWP